MNKYNSYENLKSDKENIVNVLLEGAGMEGFSFDINFRLKFSCQPRKDFEGKEIPHRVTLSIVGEWWFGDKEDWNETIQKMTKGYDLVEPWEPVLAYRLTALRWNGNATVTSVNLTSEKLELRFEGGETITILNNEVEESSWEITETVYNSYVDEEKLWYVFCDEDGIYYNVPKNSLLKDRNYGYRIWNIDEKKRQIFLKSDKDFDFRETDLLIYLVRKIEKQLGGKIEEIGDMQYKMNGDGLGLIYQWNGVCGITVIYPESVSKESAAAFLKRFF